MDAWTIGPFPGLGWQTFALAEPSPDELDAAERALEAACRELGMPRLSPAFFATAGPLNGYYSPRDPGRAWLRAGLGPERTAWVARHEAGHAANHAAYNDVGGEGLPDAFADCERFAAAFLDARDRMGIRRIIDAGVQRAVAQWRATR